MSTLILILLIIEFAIFFLNAIMPVRTFRFQNLMLVLSLFTIIFTIIIVNAPINTASANHIYNACSSLSTASTIRCVFPAPERAAALRIANCESTALVNDNIARRRGLGRWARNGQYIGIYQMGSRERARYGSYSIGSPAIRQVIAARNLWVARGWQPWACR